jgi:hypothetical protein
VSGLASLCPCAAKQPGQGDWSLPCSAVRSSFDGFAWQGLSGDLELFVSQLVIEEASAGDTEAASCRLVVLGDGAADYAIKPGSGPSPNAPNFAAGIPRAFNTETYSALVGV